MDDVVLARHRESETTAEGLVGGNAGLTKQGRAQARQLGERMAAIPIDVCLVSRAHRARETAEIALVGRHVPLQVLADLDDIGFGSFEGRPLAGYRAWVAENPPSEAPPGGESRVSTLRRFVRPSGRSRRGRSTARSCSPTASSSAPPPTSGRSPQSPASPTGCIRLSADELVRAAERLEMWCEAPSW
jgi:hypothetical protein